jgi:Na+-transporting methylmalonyl-CoA/oxaloacetate decarboxylase gamma subunit
MNDTLTTALVITGIGMTAVFLAMILIYASMHILTTATRNRHESMDDRGPRVPSNEVHTQNEMANHELQVAAIGVALARSEMTTGMESVSDHQLGGNTAWGEFYRHRQLRPGGRGRSA